MPTALRSAGPSPARPAPPASSYRFPAGRRGSPTLCPSPRPAGAAATRASAGGPAPPLRPATPGASAPPAGPRRARTEHGRSPAARRAGQTDRRTRLQAYHGVRTPDALSAVNATSPRAFAAFLLSSGWLSSAHPTSEFRTAMSQPPEYPGSPADPQGGNQGPQGYPPPGYGGPPPGPPP